ncbi:MAG: hypothetical protein HYY80_03465 [Chloroflexi bacterium]|nr:hypothetical protein [Chloroflexota bacterium]
MATGKTKIRPRSTARVRERFVMVQCHSERSEESHGAQDRLRAESVSYAGGKRILLALGSLRLTLLNNLRVPAVALILILLLSRPDAIAAPDPVEAATEEVKWSRVNIPTEGETGDWVLANGSNVQHLAMAIDGSLYSYANPAGTDYTLFKSTDAGKRWSYRARVKAPIVALATAPDAVDIVYYATASNVYESIDGGNSFISLPARPGGAGSDNITITAIAVTRLDGNSIIAVATRDSDAGQYGGVYLLDGNKPSTVWTNTNAGNYDVSAVAFSPNFTADRQLVAVVTDETDTLVTSRISDDGWGTVFGDATITAVAARAATIAFPDDYDAIINGYNLFVALDSDNNSGDVYLVNGAWAPGRSMASDLDIGDDYDLSNVDVSGLAVSGNSTAASLLAGAADSAQVYISTDSGDNWTKSRQEPSGQSATYLLMAPDFTSSGLAYAATSGDESAFSSTTDGGITWNQVGLIDTTISTIVDLAVSPDYSQDGTLFMLTFGGKHSLWRSRNEGTQWERVFSSTLASADSFKLVELSPQYGSGRQVVFLAGTNGSHSVIWKSKDNGQVFTGRGTPLPIERWTVINDNSLFLGSYDGGSRLVYHSLNSGLSYSSGTAVASQPLKAMALSPNYEQDRTLLVGNKDGRVYWSEDAGGSLGPTFETVIRGLDDGATLSGLWLRGSQLWTIDSTNTRLMTYIDSLDLPVTLTSPPDQAQGTASGNVSLDWETLKGATKYQWQLDYDTDFSTIPAGFEGDTEKSSARSPALETATTYYWRVRATTPVLSPWSAKWSFTTSLGSTAIAPELYSPEAGGNGLPIKPILQWSAIAGADSYELLVSTDASFSNPIIVKIGDYALPTTAWQSNISLDYNTTYYWKVRASGSSSYSAWSAVGAFTTESAPSPAPPVPAPAPSPLLSPSSPTSSPTLSPPLPLPPSSPPAQPTIPDWLIYFGGALLLTTVLLLITLLVLVAGRRRA